MFALSFVTTPAAALPSTFVLTMHFSTVLEAVRDIRKFPKATDGGGHDAHS